MSFRPIILCRQAVMAAAFVGVLSVAASADALSPEIAAKAKDFKEADNTYTKLLCDGSKAQQADARSARDRLQADLSKAIADTAALTPSVQKALDVAADAGEAADKMAASGNASAQDKTDAAAKFQKAKGDLREALAAERGKIEDQLAKDPGVTLAAKESCPDIPKSAARKTEKSAGSPAKRHRRSASSEQYAPASEVVAPAFGMGGGGISIGGGGVGISIGR